MLGCTKYGRRTTTLRCRFRRNLSHDDDQYDNHLRRECTFALASLSSFTIKHLEVKGSDSLSQNTKSSSSQTILAGKPDSRNHVFQCFHRHCRVSPRLRNKEASSYWRIDASSLQSVLKPYSLLTRTLESIKSSCAATSLYL